MVSAGSDPAQPHFEPVGLSVHMLGAKCSCFAPSETTETQCQDQGLVVTCCMGEAENLCGIEVSTVSRRSTVFLANLEMLLVRMMSIFLASQSVSIF